MAGSTIAASCNFSSCSDKNSPSWTNRRDLSHCIFLAEHFSTSQALAIHFRMSSIFSLACNMRTYASECPLCVKSKTLSLALCE